jgi:hypothetical protein
MAKGCTHIAGIRSVTPSALGCEECLKSGSVWLPHLRSRRLLRRLSRQARDPAFPRHQPSDH